MRATTARANLIWRVNDFFARQMIRKRPAHGLAPLSAWLVHLRTACRRGPCRFVLFKVFELQLELMDLLIQCLGRPTKLHAAQLVQLSLVLLDE